MDAQKICKHCKRAFFFVLFFVSKAKLFDQKFLKNGQSIDKCDWFVIASCSHYYRREKFAAIISH